MKKSVSILKASTALAVAASFAGQSVTFAAPAAGAPLVLAQATAEPAAEPAVTEDEIPVSEETPEAEIPLATENEADPEAAEVEPAEVAPADAEPAESAEAEVAPADAQPADEPEAAEAPADAAEPAVKGGGDEAEVQEQAEGAPAGGDAAEPAADEPAKAEGEAVKADAAAADTAGAEEEAADADAADTGAEAATDEEEPAKKADQKKADQKKAAKKKAAKQAAKKKAAKQAADAPAAEPAAAGADGDADTAEAEGEAEQADGSAAEKTEVTEEAVEQAGKKGADVAVEETTSSDTVASGLKAAQQRITDLEARLEALDAADADGGEEEVITEENSRSSDEEVVRKGDDDDDDDNDTWKILGAAAAGAAVGALIPALGGRLVQDQGDRVIVERDGEFFVRKDENELLRRPGVTVRTQDLGDGLSRSFVSRPDGSQVVTVRDAGGFVLKRTLIQPDGNEVVLIDEDPAEVYSFTDWDQTLPPLQVDIPEDRYVVDYSRARGDMVEQTLLAPPVQTVDRTFSLREIRESERVRALLPRVDLNTVRFDTGSVAIRPSEVDTLATLGQSMRDIVEDDPRELFLIEGHTDAVGSNLMNLALSDRRAESVALALTEHFGVPPENLVVQGYGERYLKEQTEGASQVNRRATVRRITPLLDRVAARN